MSRVCGQCGYFVRGTPCKAPLPLWARRAGTVYCPIAFAEDQATTCECFKAKHETENDQKAKKG